MMTRISSNSIFENILMAYMSILLGLTILATVSSGGSSRSEYEELIVNHMGMVEGGGFDPATYGFELNVGNSNRPHPAVKPLERAHQVPSSMNAKIRSLYPKKLEMCYDDHQGGTYNGQIDLGQETTTNSYQGHEFYFTELGGDSTKEVARIKMDKDQVLYVIESPDLPPPAALKARTDEELSFMSAYLNSTGTQWRHYYGPKSNGPRPPPTLYMWPADTVGQLHTISSQEGYWLCDGFAKDCHSPNPVHLSLEVISLKPRAFIIKDFLSTYEADEIIRLSRERLDQSSVGDESTGGFESTTRTSLNAWLRRETSHITESLFKRAANLLRINDGLLHQKHNVEHMQVVHYVNGQKYDSHHDWGVSGYPESRYITLLLYLTDMASPGAGGETSFPKAAGGRGIKVHPGKGSAVLFYNLLEDGNGDDLSLHAALPVREGEKWLANFWVWDPKLKREL